MGIEVIQGPEAEMLLACPEFRADWEQLWDHCPWATPFQTPGFVSTWQHIYRERFVPALVLSRTPDGKLDGLLPLAAGRGVLVVAGDDQAEYQGWICLPEVADTFPSQAIITLRNQGISAALGFRYVPSRTPLQWTSECEAKSCCHCIACRRPLLRFGDGGEVEASLRKSGNKSRLRQLKKIGPVVFRRVQDPSEIDALLSRAVEFYNRRHEEIRGFAPFKSDLLKGPLHSALARESGLLHVTALCVGDQLASLQMNLIGRKEVHLWLIAYNPELAHFSPGKLHILFLARMLREEGYEQLDLTPGVEEYKQRFANACDDVHRLTAYPTSMRRWAGMARRGFEVAAKGFLSAARHGPLRFRA